MTASISFKLLSFYLSLSRMVSYFRISLALLSLLWPFRNKCNGADISPTLSLSTIPASSDTIPASPIPQPSPSVTTPVPSTSPPKTQPTTKPATDPCSPNPCLNGGTCAVVGNTFKCTCAPGYHGTTCDLISTTFQLKQTFTYVRVNGVKYTSITSTSPLNDPTSSVYKTLCEDLKEQVTGALQESSDPFLHTNFLTFHCLGFRSGSVIADYALEFELKVNNTHQTTLKYSVKESIVNASYVWNTTRNNLLVIANTTDALAVQDYNECTNRIQGFCDAFATCVNLVGSYRCICPANYNQVGNHCVKKITRTTEYTWLYPVIATLVGLLLLIFLACLIIVLRKKRRRRKYEAPYSNESWDFYIPASRLRFNPNSGMRARKVYNEQAPDMDKMDWDEYLRPRLEIRSQEN